MGYYIDIFDPQSDVNDSLDKLGRYIGRLYAEAWVANKQKDYDNKPFDLHINSFATLWLEGHLKIFFVFDDQTKEPVGFLVGAMFRPMPFKANVFHVQEYYVQGDAAMEQALLDHVVQSIRILGCDEIWMELYSGHKLSMGPTWKPGGDFIMRRFTKA